jgi:serralysin
MAASKALVRFAFTTVSMGAITGGATPMMGYTYYPGPGKGGDVWLSTGIRKYGFADRSYGFATLAHEIGHALGLKHPNEGRPVLASSLDYPANTIMSRRAYKGDPLTDGWGPDLPSYPIGPGPLDGRALALAY